MKHLACLVICLAACKPAESATTAAASGSVTAVPASAARGANAAQQGSAPDSATADAMLSRADKARIQGSPSAPVWLVEVSDFQCPYCKMWHDSTYEAIRKEFVATGQVRMAYVNFPISTHVNAVPAATAAMCAAEQDKFWPMHDALFASQDQWATLADPASMLEGLAQKVGLKMPEFRDCVKSGVMQRLIFADRQRGTSSGVNSTPWFFIGDDVIRGAAGTQEFRVAVQKALAKAATKK
ncbi:MAG TPA: thioredoxin domain-containing protein [Gemmatimonadaceae bacterium]